jgi:hypothetical protein
MIISLIEDRSNAPHGGQEFGGSLTMTLTVVEFRQRHSILVAVVEPSPIEVVLYVALKFENHSRAFRSLFLLLLR